MRIECGVKECSIQWFRLKCVRISKVPKGRCFFTAYVFFHQCYLMEFPSNIYNKINYLYKINNLQTYSTTTVKKWKTMLIEDAQVEEIY